MKVQKYDGARDVYYDIEVDAVTDELKNYGFTDKEIEPKIEEMKSMVMKRVAELVGVDQKFVNEVDGTIVIDKKASDDARVEAIKVEQALIAEKPVEEALAEEKPIEETLVEEVKE